MSEKPNISQAEIGGSPRTSMNGKPVFTVPTMTGVNFKSHFDKKLLCDGITFTAGSGCVYSCAFCYVPDMQRKAMDWMSKHGVKYGAEGHLGVVIRTANVVDLIRKQITSKSEAFRRSKKVIYASPKVDVAGNMDLVKETVEICKVILELTDWDIRLLSKSNLLPKVAQALELAAPVGAWGYPFEGGWQSRVIYGVSTGTLDDKLAAAFEQGTPNVSARIKSLHWLQDNGYRTFGMICPSLPQAYYPTFALEMSKAIRVDRCEHVWAEAINVRGDSFKHTFHALKEAGFNIEAHLLDGVSNNKAAWEDYARKTFEAHTAVIPPGKLRFLQYVDNSNRDWWTTQVQKGAVLL